MEITRYRPSKDTIAPWTTVAEYKASGEIEARFHGGWINCVRIARVGANKQTKLEVALNRDEVLEILKAVLYYHDPGLLTITTILNMEGEGT